MTDLAGRKIGHLGFTGVIEPNGVSRIVAALNMCVNNSFDEIYLCLSSGGGYVADGVFLYNHIRSLPIELTIHNTGSISSIAVAVFVGGAKRYCSSHGMFMIHPTTIGSQPDMSATRLQSALDAALADDERTENILRERTTLPNDILSARLAREIFITPQDAVKFGLVDEVREFTLPKGHEILVI